jgi:hypothetical protein
MTRTHLGAALAAAILLVGCSSDDGGQGSKDAGVDATIPQADGIADTRSADAPIADAATADAATADGPLADAPIVDAPVADASLGPDTAGTTRLDTGTPIDTAPAWIPPYEPNEPCSQLPKLATPPTLDGVLEPGLDLFPVRQTGFVPRAGNSSRFAAAWFDTGIYFFIEVTDPDLYPPAASSPAYYGDGAEFFVDHDGLFTSSSTYDNPGTRHVIIPSPASKTEPGTRAELYLTNGFNANLAADHFASVPTATGYAIEVIVTTSDLGLASWPMSAGQKVGIDIGHNVSYADGQTGTNGYREGQYFEQGLQPWMYENQFCLTTLAGSGSTSPLDGGGAPDGAGQSLDGATQSLDGATPSLDASSPDALEAPASIDAQASEAL